MIYSPLTEYSLTLMTRYLFQVWRHTCFSTSRTTGKYKLVENGQLFAEKYTDDIIKYMAKIPMEVMYKLYSTTYIFFVC